MIALSPLPTETGNTYKEVGAYEALDMHASRNITPADFTADVSKGVFFQSFEN
jgi:hypothetical protein